MLHLTYSDVFDLLNMQDCIEVMETVLTDLATDDVKQQLRSVIPLDSNRLMGLMPAYINRQAVVGAKLITVFPDNHHKGMPSHQGIVALFDARTGTPQCIVDGQVITALRTAAVSGVASRRLARLNSTVLAILGTGEQARMHLQSMMLVRPFQRVNVWGPHRTNALSFQAEMTEKFQVPIRVCDTVKEAVEEADVICTVTASVVPILRGAWVKELPCECCWCVLSDGSRVGHSLVSKSEFYVDRIESANS